jgi:hypothetical protein
MPAATYTAGLNVKGQPAARRFQAFRDQHERRWGAFIEIKTGDPTCTIDPIGWRAPLMPEQKYVECVRGPDGLNEAGRLFINYANWIRDLKQAEADYTERLTFYAQALYGEKAGEAVHNPTPELKRYMRVEAPYWQPVYAAFKGDPWVLGLSEVKPAWAEKYFQPKVKLSSDLSLDIDPEMLAELDQQWLALQQTNKAEVTLDPDVEAALREGRESIERGMRASEPERRKKVG